MNRPVAYFSMEIGLKPEIKSYSGGLGVLAGDTLKAAADQGIDFTGVTLLYRGGYFKQILEDGYQREEYDNWNYEKLLEDTEKTIEVEINSETVKVKVWRYSYEGKKSNVDIYFLDTGLEENSDQSRAYTNQLYGAGDELRLCQEALLGIGGYKALKALDMAPSYYHMNEGHSALLTLEADAECVFTTHTPVSAGHDTFSKELAEKVLGGRANNLNLENGLNMTELALKNSVFQNAVSENHRTVSTKMFPGYSFEAITNGVHSQSWTSEHIQQLFDEYCQHWRKDSQRLNQALKIPDSELWSAKKTCKSELANLVEEKTGEKMDADVLTVGFARRSTGYKRPTLVFKDVSALEKLGEKYSGLQIVFGGKAHPEDEHGKELIQKILQYSDMLENVEVYFVEDYGMNEALKMVSGCDVWLNNPVRGQEASGTSGMKAAHSGTPQLSVLDGWWLEGHIENVTGWSIGEDYVEGENEDEIDSKSIYHKLDHILSLYENERQEWLKIMKTTIAINGSYFNTDRMIKEYVTKAYI